MNVESSALVQLVTLGDESGPPRGSVAGDRSDIRVTSGLARAEVVRAVSAPPAARRRSPTPGGTLPA